MRCILCALAVALMANVAVGDDVKPAERSRPNIVVIVADDLGYADLGCQGAKDIPTPHIDSLALNGVRFTSGYVSGPYCSPTRVGLLTGKYQQRLGNEYLTGWFGNRGMKLGEVTVAQRLHEAGYVTGMVGKWHVGAGEGYHPLERGFDEFFGILGGGHLYLPKPEAPPGPYTGPILRNRTPVTEKIDYLTTTFGHEASAFVERHRERPFFLYLAFNAVHVPLEATPSQLAKFPTLTEPRRTYAAMTSAMDDAVGEVLQTLKKAGLEERTLIFFHSDNGGPSVHSGVNGSRNDPLRGCKSETSEGGIRVPFLAQWKGSLPGGATFTQPAIQLDIAATALAAAGVTIKPEWKLDGVDLLPYLVGRKSGAPHDALYWRLGQQMAVRAGDWKLVTPYVDQKSPGPPPENYDWLAHARLFKVGSDISEAHDLTEKNPEKVRELAALWTKWNSELPSNRAPVKPPAAAPGKDSPKPPAAKPAPAKPQKASPKKPK